MTEYNETYRARSEGIMVLAHGQTGGMLCPKVTTMPINAAHALSVTHHDLAYAAAPKDADGEIVAGPAADVVNALDGAGGSDWMDLYRSLADVNMPGHRQVVVESWYWKCHICGFVLTAQPVAKESAGG